MTRINRRKLVQRPRRRRRVRRRSSFRARGPGAKGDIVIGASQPITGIFSFAGVAMNMASTTSCSGRTPMAASQGESCAMCPRTAASSSTRASRSSRRSWRPKSRRSSTATARSG